MNKKYIVVFSMFVVIFTAVGVFLYKDSHTLVKGFMTKKQLREDYEFVWDFIDTTYPYKTICIRNGVDLNSLKKEYKKLLFEVKNEYEYYVFYTSLLLNITDYKFSGHLGPMEYLDDLYDKLDVATEYKKGIKFKKLFEHTEIKDFYKKVSEQSNEAINNASWFEVFKKYNIDTKKASEFIDNGVSHSQTLISHKDISDEIGYINFLSFNIANKKNLKKYYKQVREILTKFKNKKHLIIDLRENQGGYAKLWQKAFVKNLITESVSSDSPFAVNRENKYIASSLKNYALRNDKINLSKYYRLSNEDFKNFKFAKRNKDDKKNFNSIVYECVNFYPAKESISFKGKIWVLIGKKTASAAELFAFFMRTANLNSNYYKIPVILLGKSTRGIFHGYDRIYLKLPNSGLIFKSDLGYALNPDGSCIAEEGIKPDVEIDELYALRECIRLINVEEHKSE